MSFHIDRRKSGLRSAAVMIGDRSPGMWVRVAAAAGLAVVLVGCGSSRPGAAVGKTSGSPRVVLAAYTTTLGAKTAKVSVSESVSATPAGRSTQHATVSETGVTDFTNQNGEFSISGASGTTSVRFVSPIVYLQPPVTERSQLPPGKSWAEINLNTVSEAKLGATLAQVSSSSQESTQTLAYLEAVSTNGITEVGAAKIRGAATTEYKATIDLTKAADQKIPQVRAALVRLYAELHTSSMPVQVWLDADGRVRQIAFQLKESTAARPASGTGTTVPAQAGYVTSTVDYYDFGTPVEVSAPPASQIDNLTGQVVAAATSTTTAP